MFQLREAFKKEKKVWIFSTLGGGSGPNPHFYKSAENRVFFSTFAHFCLFLTLFYRKISGNFPHFGGGGGVWEVWKISTLFTFFIEGFPMLLTTYLI